MADFVSTATVPREYARVFAFRQKMVEQEFFLNQLEKSTNYREQFRPIWDELIDNYMVTPQRNWFERVKFTRDLVRFPQRSRDRSRLKDPETHQAVETLVAQALGLVMGSREYVAVSPVGSDDYEKKRVLSRLLMAILELPGWFFTQYKAIKNAFIFGTAIVELSWLTRARMQMVKGPIFDEYGNFLGQGVTPQEVIYFDGPLFREIDIYDFYPDPSGTNIQENMMFVAKRGRISKHHAMELAEQGVWEREPTIRAIQAAEMGQKMRRDGMFSKFPALHADVPDQYGMMTFFEGMGEVPYKVSDGATNRVLTMMNGEMVRSHINPMIDGNKWFKEIIVNPLSGRFYGFAPTEAVRYIQDSLDAMLMTYTDVSALTANGPLLVGNSFGGNPNQLRMRRPLDIIMCADPKMVQPYPVDTSALGFASQEIMRRKLTIREATGASNPLQAISTGDGDKTATEFSELVRLSTQRVDMMVQLTERDFYPWLGLTVLSRLKQFAPEGGVEAYFRGERVQVSIDDINPADVYFSGSRQAVSTFQRAAQLREAINVLSTNPGFITQYPEIALIYFRDVLHVPNAENVIEKAMREAQVMSMLNMAMQGADVSGMMQGSPVGSTEEDFGTAAGETEREGQRIA